MTTADTATPRPSAWQRFTAWRRGRPFWGGLVAILAGVEIYATSRQSIGDMEIKIGPGGMASYVIPLILVAGGMLAWFTPAQRHFYGIILPAVSVYALLEINFGGWFIGTILGMVGGALIFAWTANRVSPEDAELGYTEPDDGETGDDLDHTPRHAALDDLFGGTNQTAIPRQGTPDDDTQAAAPAREDGGNGGRALAIAIVPLLLVVAGIATMKGSGSAYAAAPCRTSAASTKAPAKAAKPASTKPASTASGVPTGGPKAPAKSGSPSPSSSPEGSLLGRIIGGIVHALDPSPTPSETPAEPEPSASPTAPAPTKSSPAPKPTGKPAPRKSSTPCVSASPTAPVKRLAVGAGQPDVAAVPSRLTGSKVTMFNLVFQGIVDLPTADGSIKVLKFTMDQAVTEDFHLLTHTGGAHAQDVVFTTKTLTIQQNVVFYTSRFQGKALGLIPVDYTPENTTTPIPLTTIPPIIFFTDPDIQLVWVHADVLTGTPDLTSTLA